MRNTTIPGILGVLLMGALSGATYGQQQRVFNWLPGNDESVRLDPANYHSGLTYHPAENGGNIQVDITAEKPVTIFLTGAEEWKAAVQHPETIANPPLAVSDLPAL